MGNGLNWECLAERAGMSFEEACKQSIQARSSGIANVRPCLLSNKLFYRCTHKCMYVYPQPQARWLFRKHCKHKNASAVVKER